ncbi:MAG TPA: nucleotidyl transferase AbiEii/AbiGii toxin family protein [Bacteroidia bacterium]|nr:nucleotidyl transferase AbiEii/AbiGii toxin family protein [Bacteroidia bacterium]
MSWEESRACTPLKRDFLHAWFGQEKRFFLTGGSALGLFYLGHRLSYDLDLFTSDEVESQEVRNLVHRIAAEIGADCQGIRTAPDFHRFRLTRGEDREIVDVVVDRAPQIDPIKADFDGIRVDTLREIIANKLTTLLSRTELKDVVDLYFLEQDGHDLLAAIPDAQTKDGGWEPAVVAMLLDSHACDELPAWMIRPIEPDDFRSFLKRLRLAIAEKALPAAQPEAGRGESE